MAHGAEGASHAAPKVTVHKHSSVLHYEVHFLCDSKNSEDDNMTYLSEIYLS